MATTIIYYDCGGGHFSADTVHYPDGDPVPGPPVGCTSLTKAQFDAMVAARAAQRATEGAALNAVETFDNQLVKAPGFRTVASSQAPARIKAASAYVCTGADDQVQINNAINDTMAEGGGTVLLSTGDFNLSDSVNIPVGNGLVLAGSSWESVLKVAGNSNRYAIKFAATGETRATFRDFTVDGNLSGQTTGGGGIWATGAVQCHFLNIHFTACFDEGLHLGPISPTEFGHTNYIEGCLFDNAMDSPGQGRGIHMISSDENWVSDCDFEFLGGVATTAAAIYDQAGTQSIQACNFVNGRSGIPSVRAQDCHNTRILGCNFDGVGGTGILVTGTGHLIANNTFFGVGIHGAAGQATGIHLEFAAQNVTVANNMLATHTTNGAAHSLIRESSDGGAGNNYISGNTLVQKGTAAIGLLDLSGAGSWVRGNKGAGPVGDESVPFKLVAGPVSDASYPANRPPADGSMAVDTTNNALYVRANGVWKSTLLT